MTQPLKAKQGQRAGEPDALAAMAAEPSVANVRLLQDYLAWESRPLLRRRATALLRRMEATLIDPRPVGV